MEKFIQRFIFLSILIANTNSGCAPIRYDIGFFFSRDSQIPTYEATVPMREFIKDIIDPFPIGYMYTRVSMVVFGSVVLDIFDFQTFTTKTKLIEGIDSNLGGQQGILETKENIKYIWETMFTPGKGARDDVPNYCFMITTGESNDTYTSTGKPSTIDLWILDAQDGYSYNADYSDRKLNQLANNYRKIADITATYLDPIVSEFTGNSLFACNAKCGENYFAYDYIEQITEHADTSSGALNILMDDAWKITCCGVISEWQFWVKASGILKIGVARLNGTSYSFVGFTTIFVPESAINTKVTYTHTADENIAIMENDKIAWHSSGSNIIAYKSCSTSDRPDCPQNTKQLIISDDVGTNYNFDISTASTVSGKAFSIWAATVDNSAPTITSPETETNLEWNTEIGYNAIFLTPKDPDAYDVLTYTMSETGGPGGGTYFELNLETMTIDLTRKLLLQDTPDYSITVTATDICGNTGSITVIIGTYNAPPIVTNLPHIVEISEELRSPVPLFKINVFDATADPVCCTMPYSIPDSFNFELKQINSSDPSSTSIDLWLYTRDNPVFEYSDIDAFRVFVCCQDAYGSSFSYLIVRLIEVKQEVPYVPPDWFYRAIILSLIPIGIMTAVSCSFLLLSVYWF